MCSALILMSAKCQKRTFQSFRLIALISYAKCFTSQLRIDPYSSVSFCALVKHLSWFRPATELTGATIHVAASRADLSSLMEIRGYGLHHIRAVNHGLRGRIT